MDVAVLLATYNGARYIDQQIASLANNSTPFTLHWLDDHSTDASIESVRRSAKAHKVSLREWHQETRCGVPTSYFKLMEAVAADIYLFCDQDDIWQPGKIDATVATLALERTAPVLCFSDFLILNEHDLTRPLTQSRIIGQRYLDRGPEESRLFMPTSIVAHTQGFTRPLREAFVAHKQIAYDYAFMHDMWMYNVAMACGAVRKCRNVPTTLYRWHDGSFTGRTLRAPNKHWLVRKWRLQQIWRRAIARQARGFILASTTFPAGQKLERLLRLAETLATIDRRQSFSTLVRLGLSGSLWAKLSDAALLSLACMFGDATAEDS
jgi:rhamnosyltransferase